MGSALRWNLYPYKKHDLFSFFFFKCFWNDKLYERTSWTNIVTNEIYNLQVNYKYI